MSGRIAAPIACVAAAALVTACGSEGAEQAASTSAAPTSARPSPSASKTPTKSPSASPSSSSPSASPTSTVVTPYPLPVVYPSNAQIVGDWIVGVPTEATAGGSASFRLRGYNWRTQKTWDVTPLVGLPPARNPGSVPQLAQEDGTVRFAYESSAKGQGLNADQYAAQVVTLDAATGKVLSNCSPNLRLGQMWSVDSGPALYYVSGSGDSTRLDAKTCASLWPAETRVSDMALSNGAAIITEAVSAIDAATGATVWNEETADFASGAREVLGRTGGLVVLEEGGALTYREITTGALQGNSVASARTYALDASTGRIFTVGDGILTAYDVGGVQSWQRTGLDKDVSIDGACFGRLWVTDSRTGDIYLLKGETGTEVQPNAEVPQMCLDAQTGIFGSTTGSSQFVVKALPPLTASPGLASGSASGTASSSASGSSGSPRAGSSASSTATR